MRSFERSALVHGWFNGRAAMEGLGEKLETGRSLTRALDSFFERLQGTACVTIVDELIRTLGGFYDAAAVTGDLSRFRTECQNHPLHRLTLGDPFTERAFSKPRGYAGDAVMLDYIYRPRPLHLGEVGEAVNFMTTGVSAAQSNIWRRDHLGTEISKTVRHARGPHPFGRERSPARARYRQEHDARSRFRDRCVGSGSRVPRGSRQRKSRLQRHAIKQLDFASVQTARFREVRPHLFRRTFLPTKTASSLINRILEMLAPDGRLVIGNYAPENYGRGYMEGMMGWSLLYRNESDMEQLLNPATFREKRIYRDDPGNVVYLEVSPHWS